VVFHHPSFDFCTPICFEDAFPDHVRRFILEGVDVIVNISNDYWSLTEVEARQHAANAVFRAVENRRPVVRATASGLTMHIDPVGRQLRSLPSYVEGVLVADVPLAGRPATLYTAWGDWFPALCAAALALLAAAAGLRGAARAKGRLPA
jgi:apolipoprotein N-acyltransferase